MGDRSNTNTGRIERHVSLTGRGMGASAERVAELARLQAEHDRVTRTRGPAGAFAAQIKSVRARKPPPVSAKDARTKALPEKGPTPSLAHPDQSDQFGRQFTSEQIVLKA